MKEHRHDEMTHTKKTRNNLVIKKSKTQHTHEHIRLADQFDSVIIKLFDIEGSNYSFAYDQIRLNSFAFVFLFLVKSNFDRNSVFMKYVN